MRDPLRPVRFVIYSTTLLYGAINLVYGPGDPPSNETPLATATAAAVVGVVQLVAAIVGAIFDLTSDGRSRILKWVLFLLAVSFIYESVLVMTSTADPFSWAPLLVYAALCSVLYLSKE
jgi:hypothetical protein